MIDHTGIAESVGRTPVVRLGRVAPQLPGGFFADQFNNPDAAAGCAVATLACDSGLKYLSTDLYSSE